MVYLFEVSLMDNAESKEIACTIDKQTRVLIADDHPIVRQAIKSLVEAQPDMKLVGEASDGQEAVALATMLLPDVIVMDVGMPVMNGLEATKRIKEKCPGIAILVLTVHTEKEYILGILEAGAAGYLTKMSVGTDVINAIRTILAGETILTPSVLTELLGCIDREPIKTDIEKLGPILNFKELSLLKLAAMGRSNKNIASELHISENTVKKYLTDLFNKMDVSSRTEAVVKGLKGGLISFKNLGD